MTAYNLRSLLVAAIVISNCITWTASRRHYTHHIHRTRHRRQGAGLYLPGSYVIPGGEGTGWGKWGEISPCSRTCGGGVASQKRICLEIAPDGRPQCTGGDTKYFSCETQDCPSDAVDFRAEQCSAYDDKDFRGSLYKWIPYTKAPNPCELNCMPRGERFYYRHSAKVIDGTRCNEDSFDVCVEGVCQAVGCDMMLGSNAREDKCRMCRGNGVNCHTTSGVIDAQTFVKGYNDIMLIPAGATSIVIEEIAPSSNYLALRGENHTFYLNGHYRIDFPRTLLIAGAMWNYERTQSGFPTPDKLKCLGPTTEPLYLSLLLQGENVGIQYEFSLPSSLAPATDRRYDWVHEEFTPCSAKCGGGTQTRNVTCRSSEELDTVDEGLCDAGLKPIANQTCNNEPCPPEWVAEPWGECSKRCGSEGIRQRVVTCQQVIANGYPSLVADSECFNIHGKKPELFQECNRDAACPKWFVSRWEGCDRLCDEGKQKRQVVCYQKVNGRVEILDDQECEEEKPATEQTCMLKTCIGTDWVSSEWSGCNTCLSTVETRQVVCASLSHQIYNDSFCEEHPRPEAERPCDKTKLPPCEVQWYATQWSKCSADCGEGVQIRKVFCGLYEDGGVREVEDEKCDGLPKYNDTKPCSVPIENCPEQWYISEWEKCNADCDGGEQERRVMCFKGNKPATDCPLSTAPEGTQKCNLQPCNSEMFLSVSTTVTDDDDLPYCEPEEETFEEVGLEFESTMFSDAPSNGTYEPETTWITASDDTGSGYGTTDTTEDYTTEDTITNETGSTLDFTTESGASTSETDSSKSSVISSTTDGKTTRVIPTSETAATSTEDTSATESTSTGSLTSETKDTKATDATDATTDISGATTESDTGVTTESSGATDISTSSLDSNSITVTSDGSSVTTDSANTSDGTATTDVASTATDESTAGSVVTTDASTKESVATETGDTSVTTSPGETATTVSGETTIASVTSSGETPESTVSGATSETVITSSDTSSSSTEELSTVSGISPAETLSTVTGDSSTESSATSSALSTDSTLSGSSSESASTSSDLSTEPSTTESTTTIEPNTTREMPTTLESSASTTESSESTASTQTGSDSDGTTLSSTGGESTTELSSTSESGSSKPTDETTTGAGYISTEEGATTRASTVRETSTTVELSTTTESGESSTSGSSLSTDESTTVSGSKPTTVEGSTSRAPPGETTTESALSTEPSTTGASESTTESGSTVSSKSDSTTAELASTTVAGSESTTVAGSEATTVAGSESTTVAGSESTTVVASESSTTTGPDTSTTSESSTTISSAGTTEPSETTEAVSTEAATTISEGTTEPELISTTASGSSEGVETTTASEEGSTTTEGSAATIVTTEGPTTELSTTEGVSIFVPSSPSFTFLPKTTAKMCKPRRKKVHCRASKYGCCPDKKTPASNRFNIGCPEPPKTCKETAYGCCPDGTSPAEGKDYKGCLVTPCEETLFGCCLSDNKTAAQGNDQDGCPPPPPACASSLYGCCADNETEVAGPGAQGCPESETTSTTEAETTSTTIESTTTVEPSETTSPEITSTIGGSSTSESSESTTLEGSSTVEGSTSVAGTTALEGCAAAEYGCCYDNETAAPGPDGQGCPCNATEFGCCPDDETPAQGEDYAGCQGECKESTHGCCPDNKTPAHGPEFEGCCLLTPYGCCPDNRKPAEGPHMEGCGCKNSEHGCCPDGVTAAAGPNNEGCGCQYTTFGCCPDRRTTALGPKYEGCSCHTYQFGCCPDGISIPIGPDQQGCHCSLSKFGCCGDGKTAATGENGAGCDCSSSQFGCCLDGETPAEGPKFEGCKAAPENRQAVCSRPREAGPCNEYRVMWYYDSDYGGCSQFWYGGCESNGNNFATKEECQDVCVQPAPKDACNLPSVKGGCDGANVHWYYNSTEEQCLQFRYGGCLGNANNFVSQELCQKQCQPEKTIDTCELPIEEGPCAGNFSSWGYNTETRTCQQFNWGGCEGNGNRFRTETACKMRCNPTAIECSEPQEIGSCSDKEALWSFSQSENRCVPFYYSGCGGNENRFYSRETCEKVCPSTYEPDKCTLPPAPGECTPYTLKWFYDSAIKRCRQFYYGGCKGNANNFDSEEQCESECREEPVTTTTTTTTTTTLRPTLPPVHTEPPAHTQSQPQIPEPNSFCLFEIDVGAECPLAEPQTRYAYDSALGKCVTFQYLGCGGNQNNFPDEAFCAYYCHQTQDICQLPMLTGSCDGSEMAWFYDAGTDSCSQFTYGGCGGNDNRFGSREACEARCRVGGGDETTDKSVTTHVPKIENRVHAPDSECDSALEECISSGRVWYLDPNTFECVPFDNAGSGVACRHTATFTSQEACERGCGSFRGIDVCTQRVDAGPCRQFQRKAYFDKETGTCKEFAYGGCHGGPNRFSSITECYQTCRRHIDVCQQQVETGECNKYVLQWYYDANSGTCNQFVYTGCGGNDNRFDTREDCESRCRRPAAPPITTTTLAPVVQPVPESECRTPSSLTPCGRNATVFYYDSDSGACVASEFGNCRHPNSYPSEEACERQCGAFRGMDPCRARLDTGTCSSPVPKYYFEAATGSCQKFTYSGCGGGPNRFSSIEECEDLCGPSGPEVNEVGCDSYERQCMALVCQYGVKRIPENGCERCECQEDPCLVAKCTADQRCVATASRDPVTQQPKYTATCITERVEPDCSAEVAECSRLRCKYGVQYVRTAAGCQRCQCVPVEIDCEPLRVECERLQCQFGVEKTVGDDGCERCQCSERSPCKGVSCPAGERCVVNVYKGFMDDEKQYSGECRPVTKAGECPADDEISNEIQCDDECKDDADCRGVGKCCRRGCGLKCLMPATTTPAPITTTYAPDQPAPPVAVQQPEPQVAASEGGKATLRCLFHGNPPPKISWQFGELTIDSNVGRYRLTSDGALEIVSLFRNDTGVYICVGDNGLGRATQEIHLVVNDPVETPVGITGDENAVVTGELNRPLSINCMAYGYPRPSIYWEHHGSMVPFRNEIYEIRGNTLLIQSLSLDTLGKYTCQAYNGIGKAAYWVVSVRAYRPEGIFLEHEYIVPRHRAHPTAPPRTLPPPTRVFTTTTSTTTTTAPRIVFTVPVSTHITSPYSTLKAGAELRLQCDVDGYPEPNVYWTKDGARVERDDRIAISGSEVVSRLVISNVAVSDGGMYACHADNGQTSSSSDAQVNVQQSVVPAKCTDNPFFADCALIVRSKFCNHKYYSKFCCKSCVEAGQLDPRVAEMQADQPYRRRK